jgi:signal transduction histidine kinase/ActR/RegA family two-component response regulator
MRRRRTSVSRESSALQDLRRRLREAEDTIAAIRDGHVEALVVRTVVGEEVFTLRSADQPYRLMVEQMREGALTLAADGTVLYCNNRFAELVAQPPHRIAGRQIDEFVAPADLPKLQAMFVADGFRDEILLRSSLGTLNPAQISSTALTIDDVRTVAVVVTDLTHERVERGLRESSRLKDEFLATLSHELRTPLNVILGWTRMLLADHLPDSSRRHALEVIDQNARVQAQLVNDLVDMSTMSTGKLRLEIEPMALVPALEGALESIRPAAVVKGLTIETGFLAPEINVLADETRLQQVMWNLLSNAVKFTPPGGRIRVSAGVDGDRVRIAVADTGIGIERAFLPHVFDRFRQADSGTTRRYGGLGLGLAIVYDLVRLHGGDVEVLSEGTGLGTTVAVTLRVSPEAASPVERRGPLRETASLAGHSVLLVEDHNDSRELFAQALKNAGAAVISFTAACEALDALESVRPSVIVADIGLPGEDGYSFIRRVRAHARQAVRQVPAIAVTAYATVPDRDEALAVGFQHHMAKPIDPIQLIETIHNVMRRRRT